MTPIPSPPPPPPPPLPSPCSFSSLLLPLPVFIIYFHRLLPFRLPFISFFILVVSSSHFYSLFLIHALHNPVFPLFSLFFSLFVFFFSLSLSLSLCQCVRGREGGWGEAFCLYYPDLSHVLKICSVDEN